MKFKFYITVILATFLVGVACFLPKNAKATENICITFVYGQQTYTYNSQEVVYDKQNSDVVFDLNKRCFFDNKAKKLSLIQQLLNIGFDKQIAINYVLVGLDDLVNKMCKEIEVEKIDSQILFDASKENPFEYTSSKDGLIVDKTTLYNNIFDKLKSSNVFDVKVQTKEQMAISEQDNKNKTTLKAKFATNYQNSNNNRKSNVKLALSKFDGMVILPNEQVSFNNVVGKRSQENGYKQAKVISYGKYVDGIGGGVCQASTTIYNAVLLAGLQIDQWHRHTLKSSYVLPSFDAMVNDNGADLVFTNNTNEPIYLKTVCNDKEVCVFVYGVKNQFELSRQSVVVSQEKASITEVVDIAGEYADKVVFDNQSFYLQRPIDGLVSQGFLVGWQDGKVLFCKMIRQDKYNKVDGVLVFGGKPSVQKQDNLSALCKIKNVCYG